MSLHTLVCPVLSRWKRWRYHAPLWREDKTAQMLGVAEFGCPRCGQGALEQRDRTVDNLYAAITSTLDVDVYRIGWWTHRWWPTTPLLAGLVTGRQADGQRASRHPFAVAVGKQLSLVGRPHRPWQAEWDGCQRAVRAWTRAGAYRKASEQIDREQVRP